MTPRRPTGILLLTCDDRPGLVAAVAEFIAAHGGNIVHADQHTDRRAGVFVQRIEFELDGLRLGRDRITDAFEPVAARFGMSWRLCFSDQPRRMAILVSRSGHCLWDLLSRFRLGELEAEIPFVAGNHDTLADATAGFGIPFHHLPVDAYRRAEQEAALAELVDRHDVDLIVLARYMQVLGDGFIARFPNRIINIHHSFLPAFAGSRPYHKAHDRGVKIIGATAHFATAELDEGPIIEQDVIRVSHRESVDDMVRKGRDLERVVLARAVRLYLEHRIVVYGNKTVVFD